MSAPEQTSAPWKQRDRRPPAHQVLLYCALLLSAVGCDPIEDPVVESALKIGTEGGGLLLPGGGLLLVPKGALTRVTAISAKKIAAPAGAAFSSAGSFYELGPAGLTFAIPTTASLPLSITARDAATLAGVSAVQRPKDGSWAALPSRLDLESGRVVVSLTHFSQLGVGSFKQVQGACCGGKGWENSGAAATCAVQEPKACAGTFMGAGTGCTTAGVKTCEFQTCCQLSDGSHALMPAAACTHLEGKPLTGTCGRVCCVDLKTGKGALVERAKCANSAYPTTSCREVCCYYEEASFARLNYWACAAKTSGRPTYGYLCNMGDGGVPDAAPPDLTPPDAGPPDGPLVDAAKPDQAPPDAAKPDQAPPDAAKPDQAPPDAKLETGAPDAAAKE